MEINEQVAERDLVATRVKWEFIDIFRVRDGKLIEHWTHMDFEELRQQMQSRQ